MTGAPTLPSDPWGDADLAPFAADLATALAGPVEMTAEAAATRAAVLGRFAATSPGATPSARSRWYGWRRLGAGVGLAAALASMGVAGAAASGPGGPLYGVRLAIEAAVLPAPGPARDLGEVARLGDRLGEAEAADAAGDEPALVASLTAFARIADDAASQASPDATAAGRLAAQIARLEQVRVRDEAGLAAKSAALAAGRRLMADLAAGPKPASPSGWPPAPGGSPVPTMPALPSPSGTAPAGGAGAGASARPAATSPGSTGAEGGSRGGGAGSSAQPRRSPAVAPSPSGAGGAGSGTVSGDGAAQRGSGSGGDPAIASPSPPGGGSAGAPGRTQLSP